jgi:hypothetical protein
MESEVSPIRAELDTLIKSPAYLDPFHADNEKARATAQKLYATLYKDEGEEPAPLEEVEGTLEEAQEVQREVGRIDNPEAYAEEQAIAPLKAEWGADWEANVTAAQGMVESLSKDLGYDVSDFLEDSRLGSHPIVIKAMYAWSRGEPGPDISAAEANAILAMVRKSDLYQKGDSRARDTLLDVVQALYRVVHPEG